jgi:hypothetical protein
MGLLDLSILRLRQERNFDPTEKEIAIKMLDIVDRIKKTGHKKIALALDK